MTLKEKLGFGRFAAEDEMLAHDLAKAAKPKSRFDAAMNSLLTNLLLQLVIPWIKYCFEKYSEAEFHRQMDNGFDFIADWKTNHRERFPKFMRIARALRNRYTYDEIAIYAEVMKEFSKRQFSLREWEKTKMMATILELKSLIYSDTPI